MAKMAQGRKAARDVDELTTAVGLVLDQVADLSDRVERLENAAQAKPAPKKAPAGAGK